MVGFDCFSRRPAAGSADSALRRGAFVMPSLFTGLAAATVGLSAWSQPIERLEPGAFAQVPAPVRSGLTRLGCTVPQTFTAKRPENVIHGSFTNRSATEWAVLCSVDGTSRILVFRSNSEEPIARIAEAADRNFVQTVSPARSGFSRVISAGSRSAIGLSPIHDAFIEKASTIWAWSGQGWQAKTGAD